LRILEGQRSKFLPFSAPVAIYDKIKNPVGNSACIGLYCLINYFWDT